MLKPYQFIASKMQKFEVQNPIYWEEPQTTYQLWKGV
jgi:hypothetical protein